MADEIVVYLSENWNAAQIKSARDEVFTAHMSNLSAPTIVTGQSFDGSSTTFTIGTQPSERLRFLGQCRQALAILTGGKELPAGGIKLDFSTRSTST